jgi:hypothetical protein
VAAASSPGPTYLIFAPTPTGGVADDVSASMFVVLMSRPLPVTGRCRDGMR